VDPHQVIDAVTYAVPETIHSESGVPSQARNIISLKHQILFLELFTHNDFAHEGQQLA